MDQSNVQPTPPPQSSDRPPSPSPAQQQQELTQLRRQTAAMSQIIWNLVRQIEPEEQQLVVSSIASDPLWQLAFVAADEKNTDATKVRILAGLLQPITEQEKKRVCRLLRWTARPLHEATAQLELPHPSEYVQKQIEPYLKWDDAAKLWQPVKQPSLISPAKKPPIA